jgi:hypothetical protein
MRRELDLLVPPLRGAEVDGDDPRSMHPPEVAEDERVAGLGVVGSALGQPEVPRPELRPGMRLEEAVLVIGTRLDSPQSLFSTYWRASISRRAWLTARRFRRYVGMRN